MPNPKKSIIIRFLVLNVLLALLLTSCATVPKPVVPVKPGKDVETLQSLVSLSFKSPAGSAGGRGYLIFKRPDRFHMVVLSPFGFTVMEIFVEGDRITCLVPSKETAYAGSLDELGDRNALKGWGMMRWVIENPPAAAAAAGGKLEREGKDGVREYLYFDERGLLQKKTNDNGDQVLYGDYRQVNGVAFPSTIELHNGQGDTVKVAFDEPEINQPVEDSALVPKLDGIKVLPITDFKGL
ncbi:MAG TPA: outer membrane lipoprotein LolB [Geobacteraceae bacterium]|nr:outer membrane lipoprotein LolB [Geobacteraceae bacterium]